MAVKAVVVRLALLSTFSKPGIVARRVSALRAKVAGPSETMLRNSSA